MRTKTDIKDTVVAIKDTVWPMVHATLKGAAQGFCIGSGIVMLWLSYHSKRHNQHLEWKDNE